MAVHWHLAGKPDGKVDGKADGKEVVESVPKARGSQKDVKP